MDVLGTHVDLLTRLMSASALRNEVHMHNLANENTPGFRRSVVEFEEHLKQALLESGDGASSIQPSIVTDDVSPAGPDGNNVSEELELNSMRENQLLYETYASILKTHFDLLRTSITSR